MSEGWDRFWPVGFLALLLLSAWVALSGGILLPTADATPKLADVLWIWLTSLWPAVLIILASWGPGWWALRGLRIEPRSGVTEVIVGLAAMMLGWYVVAWVVGLWVWMAWGWGLMGLGVGALAWQRAGLGLRLKGVGGWHWLWVAPGVGVLLAACTLPPGTLWRTEAYGYDVLSYHLQTVREWWSAGAMVELEHNVYGYLPGLMESAYAWVIGLRGGDTVASAYACQILHAMLAVLAALRLAETLRGRSTQSHDITNTSVLLTASAMLVVPWVLITGTLAYNEMAVLAFGASALHIMLLRQDRPAARGMLLGVLVGVATLSKLTAGLFVGVPIGLMLLTCWGGPGLRGKLTSAACAGCIGLLVLSPYLLRNTTWTGNPVFPFAANTLGSAHWREFEIQRWGKAHGMSDSTKAGEGWWVTLDRQWLRNTGYGAMGGTPAPRETQNIARFDHEGGFPLLLILATIGCAAGLLVRSMRAMSITLALWLAYQLIVWWVTTHHQSRFLLPTVLPIVLLAGIGLHACIDRVPRLASLMMTTLIGGLVMGLVMLQVVTMWQQTQRAVDTQSGERVAVPPWFWADTLGNPDRPGFINHHAINTLPRDAKVLLVADTASLLYLNRPIVYATAFDEDPLGRRLRAVEGDRSRLINSLRDDGITHVWVGWSELDRLHNTYGFDPDVTVASVQFLLRGWPVVLDAGAATLFAVPVAP